MSTRFTVNSLSSAILTGLFLTAAVAMHTLWLAGSQTSVAQAADRDRPGRNAPHRAAVDWDNYELGEFYPLASVGPEAVHEAARAVVSFQGATGFIVSPDGHILTNHHVYQSFGQRGTVHRMRVDGQTGRPLQIELVMQSERYDVALYKTETRGLPWLRMRTSPPRVGEPVFVLGHPNKKPLRASFGTVLAKNLEIGGRPSVEYSAQTWWGSSGSPVLDRKGQVFAIHWGWDSTGKSNGRLTGVPFDLMVAALPAIADVADLSRARALPRPTPSRDRTADACRQPGVWSIRTELVERDRSTNAAGRSLDSVDVRLAASRPECMALVQDVTYRLHPTFKRPIVRGDAERAGFPIRLGAWGYFEARADVRLRDDNRAEPLSISGMVRWN